MLQVSVVVLSHNKRSLLEGTLERLCKLEPPALELILVDNASSDGTQEMIKTRFPSIILIEERENSGVARGRNRGFKEAKGEFIIYLDDDVMLPLDVVGRTVDAFHCFPRAGCLAFEIVQKGSGVLDCPDGTRLGNYYGAAHAFRASALRAIDFLEEAYWFGAEEIDSSLRLYLAGYETIALTSVRADHLGPRATGRVAAHRAADWYANFFEFYFKYFPLTASSLFISRMTVSYASLCVRSRTWKPLSGGLGRIVKRLPRLVADRRASPAWLVAFYSSPDLVPPHYNESLVGKLRRKLARGSR